MPSSLACTVMCACLFVVAESSYAGDTRSFEDWKSLEKQLIDIDYVSLSHAGRLDAPAFQAFAKDINCRMAFEMIVTSQSTIVAMAGYDIVKTKYPKRQLEAALRVLINSSKVDFLVGAVYLDAPRIDDLDVVSTGMPVVAYLREDQLVRVGPMIAAIKPDLLWKWFHEQELSSFGSTSLAIVLDTLYQNSDKLGKPPSTKMTRCLNELKTTPGTSRLIYCIHATDSGPEFEALLRGVLTDESLDDVQIVILAQAQGAAIKNHIDVDALEITDARKALIRKYMEQEQAPTTLP